MENTISFGLSVKNICRNELKIQNCNSLKDLRAACNSCPKDVIETLQPVIDLLKNIIHWLQLKGVKFDTYDAADDDEIGRS